MGRISYEDKMRIQTLHEQGLGAKAIRSRYLAKQWSLNTLKTICRRIAKTGSAVTCQSGSGWPKSARTAQNTAAVGDMICSQEDQQGTSKSSRQIAKTLGMRGTGHWSEGSLVRKLYSRTFRGGRIPFHTLPVVQSFPFPSLPTSQ